MASFFCQLSGFLSHPRVFVPFNSSQSCPTLAVLVFPAFSTLCTLHFHTMIENMSDQDGVALAKITSCIRSASPK